ncbi:Duffy receptor-like isoform X3 [Scylla paramamosain]|uniref:Duffy receptor-like isoform X3 n=1 Tax=Scylla paramamosain TaxID=85552 RepID=UPI003082A93B
MRAFSWVPLLGLLAALAAAQESMVDPESVVTQEEAVLEEATHKTASSSPTGILQAVQNLVASAVSPLNPDSTPAEETKVEGPQLDANPFPVNYGEDDTVAEEEVVPTNPSELEEAPTVLTNRNEEESPVESNSDKNNNQVQLVGVYNDVVDNVLDVLSSSLSKVGPLPIELSDDVVLSALKTGDEASLEFKHEETDPAPSFFRKLTALDAAEAPAEPEPEPEPSAEKKGNKNKTRKETRNKNKKNKKNKNRKNKRKGEVSDVEDSERKTNKNTRKNKNKGVNNEKEEVEEEVKVRPANKGNKKKNKNKNKNKRNNKRRNTKKNKKRNKSEGIEISRDGRAMSEDEDVEDEESSFVEQARRNYPERKNKGGKKNKRKRKNNKNKKNRKNKDRKNAKNSEKESRADLGPVYPSPEELATSNAYLIGHSTLSRIGDVTVERAGKAFLVNAKVQVGPVFVQLADAARALKKSQVSTVLEADMEFKVRSKGHGRKLIKVNSVTMGGPSKITVARLDLPLEPEVVVAAQDEVLNALDVSRVGRIFEKELEKIFEEDNVVQNLENHPFLKK